MSVISGTISLSTKGDCDIVDVTPQVVEQLEQSGLKNGIATVSVIGSTGALTTCEFEPGLVRDIKETFNKLVPQGKRYHHDDAWGDGNGHAHLRASLVGPSLTTPFQDGKFVLGTWQQIIFIDFDNRPRQRKIAVQFLGE